MNRESKLKEFYEIDVMLASLSPETSSAKDLVKKREELYKELFAKEEWRAIPGFEGMYEVSSNANVRSLPRKFMNKGRYESSLPGRMINIRAQRNGYVRFDMHRRGKRFTMYVHQAVALAFVPNPAGKRVVNHKDGVRGNNLPSNLEWSSLSWNTKHGNGDNF